MKSKLLELRNRFVPKRVSSGKPKWKEKGTFPINKSLQEAIRNKQVKHRRWIAAKQRDDGDTARLEYAKARNKVKTMIRQAKRKFEKGIADKSKSNPKLFWAHVRGKLKQSWLYFNRSARFIHV